MLALLTLMLFSGCDAFSIAPESVMTIPHPVGDQQAIERLIDECANGKYTLMYPLSGDRKSSIFFEDITADGKNNAIALYKTEDNTLHILFAKVSGASCSLLGDQVIDAEYVDRVDFIDTDGDGRKEILIGSFSGSTKLRQLTRFVVEDEISAYDVDAVYNYMITGDLDGDNKDEILSMLLNTGDSVACARMLGADDSGKLGEEASCALDPTITALLRISHTKLESGIPGVVIDGIDTDNQYATQLLYYDTRRSELMNPLLLYAAYNNTRRAARVMSADVDSDSQVEIPAVSLMEYDPSESGDAVCSVIEWSGFDPQGMTMILHRRDILCPDGSYTFTLSDERADSVTARYDTDDRSLTVYRWEQDDTGLYTATDRLLTIHEYAKSSYDQGEIIEAVAGQNGTTVFTYTIDDPYAGDAFTDDEVTRSFSPVSEI